MAVERNVCIVGDMHWCPMPVAEEVDRLRNIESAARALWLAHCKSSREQRAPQKFGMNYGELVTLANALGFPVTGLSERVIR